MPLVRGSHTWTPAEQGMRSERALPERRLLLLSYWLQLRHKGGWEKELTCLAGGPIGSSRCTWEVDQIWSNFSNPTAWGGRQVNHIHPILSA